MKPFIFETIHAWESNGQILLSNEVLKKLHSFANTDSAINWLFVSGHKPAARALNAHVKGSKFVTLMLSYRARGRNFFYLIPSILLV